MFSNLTVLAVRHEPRIYKQQTAYVSSIDGREGGRGAFPLLHALGGRSGGLGAAWGTAQEQGCPAYVAGDLC